MAESKHTPGPWSIVQYGDYEIPNLVIHSDSKTRVCFMATAGSHDDSARIEANARLIAAAPDLLKALRALVTVHRALDTTGVLPADKAIAYGQAEAAICKATGSA